EARGGELEEHVALREVSATVERGYVSRQRQLAGRPDLVAEACRGGPAPPNQQVANAGHSRSIDQHVGRFDEHLTASTNRTAVIGDSPGHGHGGAGQRGGPERNVRVDWR